MTNPLANRMVTQHTADHRFTRPIGSKITEEDLHRYAEELNAGPMRGWFVNRDKAGRAFLDRK